MEQQAYAFDDTPGTHSDPDRRAFRRALGRYPTGVTVVTTRTAGGEPVGLTVNSFAAVSLYPPLVLWSLGEDSANAADFRAAAHFAINVLAADQADLARQFARTETDRFVDVAVHDGLGGAPVLEHALSVFECSREAIHPGGDHHILIGRVARFATRPGRALVFHDSDFLALPETFSDGA